MQSFGQKTKDALATDDKYWRPPCNVTNRDALSAISRAKTERCRKEISSVSCMTERNALYPDFIKKYVQVISRVPQFLFSHKLELKLQHV